MRRVLFFILSLFVFNIVYAEEYHFVYTQWSSVFPQGVESFRIQAEERYRWYRINEQGDFEETDEYFTNLDGYEKIEDSLRVFYRVLNNDYVVFNSNGELIEDLNRCRKVFCTRINLKKYEEPKEEEPIIEEPVTPSPINPETYDGIYNYIFFFIICLVIIIIKIKRKSSYVESL